MGIKIGVESGFSPFFYGFCRFILASCILLIILKIKNEPLKLKLNQYKDIIIASLFLVVMCFAGMNWAEQYISSGIAAILTSFTPFIVILIESSFYKRKIIKQEIIGFFIAIAGLSLVLKNEIRYELTSNWLIGILVMMIGVIGFATGTVKANKVMSKGLNPLVFNAFQMFFGSIGLLIFSIIFNENWNIKNSNDGILALLYLAICGSIIASSIYHYLIKKINSFIPSTWTYISPVISLFVGSLFLGEKINVLNFIGVLIVILGLLVINNKVLIYFKSTINKIVQPVWQVIDVLKKP